MSSSEEDDDFEPRRKKLKMIDDAAEESGEGSDDEDDDDEEAENEYVNDGFVVGEEEEQRKKSGDLEDSDEDDDDDDEDDDEAPTSKKLQKVRKMKATDRLDEDDLALIKESRGEEDDDVPERPKPEQPVQRVVAKTEAELRKGLFHDSDDDDQVPQPVSKKKPMRVERYDEDGMDDFIEDDIGDQGDIMASDRRGYGDDDDDREITEAQLQEATDIFGSDYLDYMKEERDEDEEEVFGKKYRERGVGVDLGVDSEDELSDDDDDDEDLFGDDDDEDDDGLTAAQRAEARRLKREKRNLQKAERRRKAKQDKADRRKAKLRRAFEPVQLVENFCTERDDEIRLADVPERFFDWSTPFAGSEAEGMNEAEEKQAAWIASRIPNIHAEYSSAEPEKQAEIRQSIANALRFMHVDKVEPAFVKRYRKDLEQVRAWLRAQS